MTLSTCSHCRCHVVSPEEPCPHCGADLAKKRRHVGPGAILLAVSALGLAAGAGCGDDETTSSTANAGGAGGAATTSATTGSTGGAGGQATTTTATGAGGAGGKATGVGGSGGFTAPPYGVGASE